jgi:hypothetical protein
MLRNAPQLPLNGEVLALHAGKEAVHDQLQVTQRHDTAQGGREGGRREIEKQSAPVSVVRQTTAKGAAYESRVETELPVDEGRKVEGQLLHEKTAKRVGHIANDKHHQPSSCSCFTSGKGVASLSPVAERGVQVLQYARSRAHQMLL